MSNQIPHYSFLTAQFLIFFEKHKQDKHFKEVNDLFLKQLITEPKLDAVNYANFGLVIMLSYSLIVFPREYWKNNIDYNKLESFIKKTSRELNVDINETSDLFIDIDMGPDKYSLSNLIKKLRDAISHADIKYDSIDNIFHFLHYYKGEKKLDARISLSKLSILITGIGKYFCNIQGKETEK